MHIARNAFSLSCAIILAQGFLSHHALAQNAPPNTPTILEPQADRPLDPYDVHMETAPFSDPNPGDLHACSDFEIWSVTPSEPVWVASCVSGAIAVHTHLGDGEFVNGLASRLALNPDTPYVFRVRHKDNSGDPATEWSEWSYRDFTTGSLSQVYSLELHDIAQAPVPQLTTPQGAPFVLPNSAGSKAEIRVVAACCNSLLLSLRASANGNVIQNPPPLSMHMPLKVTVIAGSDTLNLPELDLQFVGGNGKRETIFLPSLSLAAGDEISYWVASEGSTYNIEPGHNEPHFDNVARRNLAPWTTTPDFKVSVFATGLQLPVHIAMIPNAGPNPTDPLFYVTELYGNIKLVLRNGTVTDFATNLLNFDPLGGFPGSGEGGLGGIAIDPQSGDVFVSMLYMFNPNQPELLSGRVQRIQALNGGRDAGQISTILDISPALLAPSHQISNLMFMTDGSLLVNVGDGFNIAVVQDIDDPRGKVLRITPTGLPVMTNPYYNANDGITTRDYVYTRGYRNPFGGDRRPFDNTYWVVENGPGIDRLSLLIPGRNYGYDGSDESMGIFATYNWIPSTAPVDIAFLSAARYSVSGFPSNYTGRGYVTLSGSTFAAGPGSGLEKCIQELIPNFTETLQAQPRVVARYAGTGVASCSAIAPGPGGLYFADLYKDDSLENPIARGSQILLLSYQAPPDCNANSLADIQECLNGTTPDCNWNLVPDSCDIVNQFSTDCNSNNIPDECDTTSAEFTNFAADAGPFFVNGGAQLANGVIDLDSTFDGDEGAIIHPALRGTPLTRLQASFDFRMGGDLQNRGFSFSIFEQSRPDFIFFGDAGATNAPLTLRFGFDPGEPGGPNVIEVLRDGVTRESKTVGNFADGQWRTIRVAMGPEGLTVQMGLNGTFTPIYVGDVVDGFVPDVFKMGFGAQKFSPDAYYNIDNVTFFIPNAADGEDQDFLPESCDGPPACDSIDFNNDNSIFDPQDIEAFLSVYSEGPCIPATATCNDIDFNNDGSIFDPEDINSFLRVYSEGPCRL